MVRDTPVSQEWAKKWRECKLESPQSFDSAIKCLMGEPLDWSIAKAASHTADDTSSLDPTGKALFERTTWYAGRAAQALNFSSLSKRLASYQQVVLVSTCCVLVKHGIPKENIYSILRASVSISSDKNLDRLLSGGFF